MPSATQQSSQRRGRSQSRYGKQLREKQELKQLFGIREEQLKKYYTNAKHHRGETGPSLISILERRLDNTVFRSGLAQTRAQARQMTSHGLFTVNGTTIDVPSYLVKVGDTIAVKDSKRDKSYFSNFSKRMQGATPPSWIQLSPKEYSFSITDVPKYEEANLGVDIRAVVEFFAR